MVQTIFRLQEPTTLTWVREEGEIPQGRGADNGGGLLQIQESKVVFLLLLQCIHVGGIFT